MPSARDLLQQADALMRSHRNVGSAEGQETVPVLTDVAIPAGAGVVTRQRVEEIPVLTNVVAREREPEIDLTIPDERPYSRVMFSPTQTGSLLPLSEMPSVPEFEQDRTAESWRPEESLKSRSLDSPTESDEIPKWLEADLLDASQRNPAQSSASESSEARIDPIERDTSDSTDHERAQVLESAPLDIADARIDAATDEPPPAFDAAAASDPPGAFDTQAAFNPPPDALSSPASLNPPPAFRPPRQPVTSAEDLAETVYFQVLQNLDLYTERALQQHMTAHLSPIIERATQELLTTLNANLGALMRQFVADAVEKQLGERPAPERPEPNL